MNIEQQERVNRFLSCFKIAIFDAEGVLFDTSKLYFLTYRKMARELMSYDFTLEDQRELAGTLKKKGVRSVELFANKIGFNLSNDNRVETINKLTTIRDSIFMKILLESTQTSVKPGAQKLLDALRMKGIILAISTSSSSRQLEALFSSQNVINKSIFKCIVCYDKNPEYDFTRDKSVLNNVLVEQLKAQLRSGITPSCCIMFEDSVEGTSAAKRSGIGLVIAVPDSHSRHLAAIGRFRSADLVIQDLEYFTKLIT